MKSLLKSKISANPKSFSMGFSSVSYVNIRKLEALAIRRVIRV